MTERLYDQDAFLRTFSAVVTGCEKMEDGYAITLDRTAFYPEGGGQPGDRGVITLEDAEEGAEEKDAAKEVIITDTREKDGEVFHFTSSTLRPGTRVTGRIDWDHRFDLMQNHSGEHIVSGLIHAAYGYNNVGFHMGADFITIDLDGELSMEQLRQIEEKANQVIWNDVKTEIITCFGEAAKELEYRSKKELSGEIRIVTFPGADSCACCGTHVSRTGQIGLIKLISVQKFRAGVRIELLCGRRALQYLSRIWEENHTTSVLLSARPLETGDAVRRLKKQHEQEAYRLVELERARLAAAADQLKGKGDCVLFLDGLDAEGVRRMATEGMQRCGGICLVFSGSEEDGYKYAVGKADADLRSFVKEMNLTLSGRGGGKPHFAQGSVSCRKADIRAFLSKTGILWYNNA